MSTVLSNLIPIFLSLDKFIYGAIGVVYELIIKLANYQIFSQDYIADFSRRVYALIGIFMLFKITFSMIVYLVNPDEFLDKSKGFGHLIKNVIVSLVLIVAVPYIFAEAFYVQKMVLSDGTIAKLVLGDQVKNESLNIEKPGANLKFLLFSQFIKPNSDDFPTLMVCDDLFETTADGQYVQEDSETGLKKHTINATCKETIKCLFDGNKSRDTECSETEQYVSYVSGIENGRFSLLTSHDSIYTTTPDKNKNSDSYKQPVISYKWFLSTIIGIIVCLILVTICLDVALRTIKLGFYQIIAPIPIIANCDPKTSKNNMLQKWAAACVQTYFDLFLRLLGLFLSMQLIDGLTESNKFSGFATIILIIGALMFAKQLPKILQDLTGLKLDGKFTLNPFKKIKNEIPESLNKSLEKSQKRAKKVGQRVTGAAGGMLSGVIGGGRNFGERALSGALGTVRGAAIGKGFGAGVNAQADVNRKIRDARIKGATFMRGVGAAAASVFGLDYAELEKRAKILEDNKDAIKEVRTRVDDENRGRDNKKKQLEKSIAPKQSVISQKENVKKNIESMEDWTTNLIKSNKAGRFSRTYNNLVGQASIVENLGTTKVLAEDLKDSNGNVIYGAGTRVSDAMYDRINSINRASGPGLPRVDAVNMKVADVKVLTQDIVDSTGKVAYKKGDIVDSSILGEIKQFANRYAGKEGRAEFASLLMESEETAKAASDLGIGEGDLSEFKRLQDKYEESVNTHNFTLADLISTGELKIDDIPDDEKDYYKDIDIMKTYSGDDGAKVQKNTVGNTASKIQVGIERTLTEINSIERQNKANTANARVKYVDAYGNVVKGEDGSDMISLEEAERHREKDQEEYNKYKDIYDNAKKSADANRQEINMKNFRNNGGQ